MLLHRQGERKMHHRVHLRDPLATSIAECDVLVMRGGASMGSAAANRPGLRATYSSGRTSFSAVCILASPRLKMFL